MKSYRLKTWFTNEFTKCECGGSVLTRQWIEYKPEYKKIYKIKCQTCKKEWFLDKLKLGWEDRQEKDKNGNKRNTTDRNS